MGRKHEGPYETIILWFIGNGNELPLNLCGILSGCYMPFEVFNCFFLKPYSFIAVIFLVSNQYLIYIFSHTDVGDAPLNRHQFYIGLLLTTDCFL